MKTISVATGAASLCLLMATLAGAEEKPVLPGKLVHVDKSGPQTVEVGDLVQIAVGFPVVPNRIINNLKVEVQGNAAQPIIVVRTTRPKIVGAGEYSAYVKADKKGEATIKVTPVDTNGKTVGEVIEVKLEVVDKK